jgi:hypothetical protein
LCTAPVIRDRLIAKVAPENFRPAKIPPVVKIYPRTTINQFHWNPRRLAWSRCVWW